MLVLSDTYKFGGNMLFRFIIALMFFVQAKPLQAMIDFQIMGGYRDATFELGDENYDLATTELGAALHLSPFKKVPIAFGISYLYLMSEDDDTEQGDTELNIDDFGGYEVGAEIYVWHDIKLGKTFTIHPYLKGSYIFSGEYRFDIADEKAEYDVNGWYVAIGIGDNGIFLPSISGLIEVGIPIMNLYNPRINDIEVDPVEDLKYKAWDLKFVVEFKI